MMNKEQILGLVRHVLTIAAGYFIAEGKLDPGAADSIIGGLLAIVGVLWSVKSPEKA